MGDDGMADVEFAHFGNGGDALHIVIVQAVPALICNPSPWP